MLVFPLLGLANLCGCATGRMQAVNLPRELEAPLVQSAKSVDLSKLAMDVPSGDLIDAGDVVDVTVAASLNSQDTLTFPVRVNDRGQAMLPVIGEVPVAGLDLVQAEAAIAAAAVQRGLYRAPQVTVTMKQRRMNRVMVAGAVKTPGVYQLPRRSSDMLAAVLAAGGLAEDAGLNVEIRNPPSEPAPFERDRIARTSGSGEDERGFASADGPRTSLRPKILTVNLIEASGTTTDGYYVEDGGVVMVEKRTPAAIHVLGLVRKPGQYDFPLTQELRLLDAVALGGGTSVSIADKAFIVRKLPDQPPVLIQASLRKAKQDKTSNLRLAEGDVVSIEHSPGTAVLETLQILRLGVGASLNSLF